MSARRGRFTADLVSNQPKDLATMNKSDSELTETAQIGTLLLGLVLHFTLHPPAVTPMKTIKLSGGPGLKRRRGSVFVPV